MVKPQGPKETSRKGRLQREVFAVPDLPEQKAENVTTRPESLESQKRAFLTGAVTLQGSQAGDRRNNCHLSLSLPLICCRPSPPPSAKPNGRSLESAFLPWGRTGKGGGWIWGPKGE